MLSDLLQTVVSEYKDKYGQREYRYYKKYHSWKSGKRGRAGSFFTAFGNGETITRDEYLEGVADGKRNDVDAFMGRSKKVGYYTYHKKVITKGWVDFLVADVESIEDIEQ